MIHESTSRQVHETFSRKICSGTNLVAEKLIGAAAPGALRCGSSGTGNDLSFGHGCQKEHYCRPRPRNPHGALCSFSLVFTNFTPVSIKCNGALFQFDIVVIAAASNLINQNPTMIILQFSFTTSVRNSDYGRR